MHADATDCHPVAADHVGGLRRQRIELPELPVRAAATGSTQAPPSSHLPPRPPYGFAAGSVNGPAVVTRLGSGSTDRLSRHVQLACTYNAFSDTPACTSAVSFSGGASAWSATSSWSRAIRRHRVANDEVTTGSVHRAPGRTRAARGGPVKAIRVVLVTRSREPEGGKSAPPAPIDGVANTVRAASTTPHAPKIDISGLTVPTGKTWRHYRYRTLSRGDSVAQRPLEHLRNTRLESIETDFRARQPVSTPLERDGVLFVVLLVSRPALACRAGVMRTVDTGNVIAGNYAFKQAAVQASDRAMTDAMNNLASIVSPAGATRMSPTATTTSPDVLDAGGFRMQSTGTTWPVPTRQAKRSPIARLPWTITACSMSSSVCVWRSRR